MLTNQAVGIGHLVDGLDVNLANQLVERKSALCVLCVLKLPQGKTMLTSIDSQLLN